MNHTFNVHRFALMVRFDTAEKGRNYAMMAAVLIFCLLAMMVPVALSDEYSNFLEILHYFALMMILLFGGSLYTSSAFSQFSSLNTGISALMIPASKLEKFLSSLLLNFAFTIPFLIFFWQLHYSTIDIANGKLPAVGSKYRYIPHDFLQYFTYSYIVIQATVFLGSIYFKKSAYIKTAALFIGFVFLVGILNYAVAARLSANPSRLNSFPFAGWKLWYYYEEGVSRAKYIAGFYHITYSDGMSLALQAFVVFFAIMLWTCAYFQLKEREI